MGVNPTSWGYSPYEDIINKLVAKGIPRDQIAAMGDAESDAKKQALSMLDAGMAIANDPSGMNPPDDFGTATEGTPVDKTFEIDNSSSHDVSTSNLSLPSGFSLVGGFPADVPANGSATFTVQMDATSISSRNGELLFSDTDDGGGDQYQFAISGTVNGLPNMQVFDGSMRLTSGASDDLGVATTYDDYGLVKSFTIDNVGAGPLTISSVDVPAGFSLESYLPMTVQAGQSGSLTVNLAASQGNYAGPLTIHSDDGANNPFVINLTGAVVSGGGLEVVDGATQLTSGDDMSFGQAPVGSDVVQTLTFTNNSTSPILLVGDTLNSPDFIALNSISNELQPGDSAPLAIRLNTAVAGMFMGQMSVSAEIEDDNGAADYGMEMPFTLNLDGTVTSPFDAGQLTVYDGPTLLSQGGNDGFGTFTVGDTAAKTFTVTNTAGTAFSIDSIDQPSGFTLQSPLPEHVPPNGSTSFTVNMDTSSPAYQSGQMSFSATDATPAAGDVPSSLAVTLDGDTTGTWALPYSYQELYDRGDCVYWTSITNGYGQPATLMAYVLGTALDLYLWSGPSSDGQEEHWSGTISSTDDVPLTLDPDSTGVWPYGTSAQVAASLQAQWSGAGDWSDQFGIGISGTVVPPPEPRLSVSNGFMPITAGDTDSWHPVLAGASDQQTYTISNYGNGSLTLAPTSLVLPASFSLVGDFPTSIAVGQSATFTLSADTRNAGDDSGSVSFVSNDAAQNPFQFTVSAQVLQPPAIEVFDGGTPIVAGTGSDDFGATPQGDAVTESLSITNTGTTVITIDAGSLSVPDGFRAAAPLPSSLAAGASATFAIEFNAAYAGSYGGTVSFTDSDTGNNPYTFQVSATAVQPPTISVQATTPDASLPEDASGQFTVTRSGDTSTALTIPLTVSGTAVSGADYESFDSSITFAAGETIATISVTPISGDYFTGNRAVTLALAAPSDQSYQLGWPASATVTITGDPLPLVSIMAAQPEASFPVGQPATLTITRTGPINAALTVGLSLSGPAINGADYQLSGPGFQPVDNTVTIAAGSASTTITVTPLDNGQYVTTANVSLTSSSGYNFGTSSTAAVTIVEQLESVTIQATQNLADAPSGTPGTFTVTRSSSGALPLTVELSLSGTGVLDADFQLSGATIAPPGDVSVTIPAGAWSTAVTINPVVDTLGANTQTVVLTVTGGDQYSAGTPASDTVTIDQDLVPPLEVYDGDSLIANGSGSDALGSAPQNVVAYKTFTIDNTGARPLNFLSGSFHFPSDCDLATPPANPVAPGGSTTFMVEFAPDSVGAFSGTIAFQDTYGDGYSFQVTFSGLPLQPRNVTVDSFGLVDDTGVSSADLATSDPRVTGTADGLFFGGSAVVQFDDNGNAPGSSAPFTTSGTTFIYDPRQDDPSLAGYSGPYELQYRLLLYDADGSLISTGPWNDFAITLVPPEQEPYVADFGLVNDTGGTSPLPQGEGAGEGGSDQSAVPNTYDPRVTGVVRGDFSGNNATVQFDHNGDMTPLSAISGIGCSTQARTNCLPAPGRRLRSPTKSHPPRRPRSAVLSLPPVRPILPAT